MIDQVILLSCVLGSQVFQVVLEYLFGNLGAAHFDFLDRFAVGGLFGWVPADAPSEVVLATEDDERAVVDSVDLLADEHHAHGLGHPAGDVVESESYFL